jgi:hypothetical protein
MLGIVAALVGFQLIWSGLPPTPREQAGARTPALAASMGTDLVTSLQDRGACGSSGGAPETGQMVWASQVKARHEDELLQAPGVVGLAVGCASHTGGVAILIYVDHLDEGVRRSLPVELEGVQVQLVESGEFTPR